MPGANTITGIVPTDGTLTVSVVATDEALKQFVLYKLTNKSATWSAENANFSRTGSGDIAITSLPNGIEYDVISYQKDALETVISPPSNVVSGYPDEDAEGTYRHDRKIYIRNSIAQNALYLAKIQGERMVFKNSGSGTTGVTVYGTVSSSYSRNVGIRNGAIDLQEMEVTIPRQTNFPPDNFDINSVIEVDGQDLQIQSYITDPDDRTYAAIWMFSCSAIRGQETY